MGKIKVGDLVSVKEEVYIGILLDVIFIVIEVHLDTFKIKNIKTNQIRHNTLLVYFKKVSSGNELTKVLYS